MKTKNNFEILRIHRDEIRFDFFDGNIYINDIIEKTDNKIIIESNFKYLEEFFFDVPFFALIYLEDSRELLHIKINKLDILRNYCNRSDLEDEDFGSICLFPTFEYKIDYELIKKLNLSNGYTHEFIDYFDEFAKDTNIKYEEKIRKYREKEEQKDRKFELALEKWEEYKKENNLVFEDIFKDMDEFYKYNK